MRTARNLRFPHAQSSEFKPRALEAQRFAVQVNLLELVCTLTGSLREPIADGAIGASYAVVDSGSRRQKLPTGLEAHVIEQSRIQVRPWRRMAQDIRLDADEVIQRVDDFARQLPDHVVDTQRQMMKEGIDHPLVARLARRLTASAGRAED